MLDLFKRDHFILGYEHNDILYIKNGTSSAFDNLKRLGYDSSEAIHSNNNLLTHAHEIKIALIMPMRRNILLSPLFTVVCELPITPQEVAHLYQFCKLLGGINITVSRVSSVKAFLDKPNAKLVQENYKVSL